MNSVQKILVVIISTTLLSCDSRVLWNEPPYKIQWIDSPDKLKLVYELSDNASISRVGPKIMALGSNNKYIVIKNLKTQNGLVEYYYLNKLIDHKYANSSDAVSGPFSKKIFNLKKKELILPDFNYKF